MAVGLARVIRKQGREKKWNGSRNPSNCIAYDYITQTSRMAKLHSLSLSFSLPLWPKTRTWTWQDGWITRWMDGWINSGMKKAPEMHTRNDWAWTQVCFLAHSHFHSSLSLSCVRCYLGRESQITNRSPNVWTTPSSKRHLWQGLFQ